LFRGRYKAIVLEAEPYLASVIRYIHLNPVQAKLVKAPETYRGVAMLSRFALSWLCVSEVLDSIGPPRVFHEFVLSGNEENLVAFYAAGRQLPVLGTERFEAWVRKKVRPLSSEHPRYERVKVRPSVRQVLRGVADGLSGEGRHVTDQSAGGSQRHPQGGDVSGEAAV
jgi:hypothetical protein